MDVSFEINATQDNFEGALLFKLQRYSDSQYNVNTPITETNETTCIQMLIAWKVEGTKPFAHIILIEHAREFAWNEYKFLFIYLLKLTGTCSSTEGTRPFLLIPECTVNQA
jgi:hypothetical protein